MGWTYFKPPGGKRAVEILRDEIRPLMILRAEQIGSTVYAAVKAPSAPAEVFAMVFLIHRRNGQFGYKDMGEEMGPYESDCPASILNMLTDTDSQYARDWRARCWSNIRAKAARVEARLAQIIGAERAQAECRGLFD
jgi:hypothetical protein